jgi:hypothetical protein
MNLSHSIKRQLSKEIKDTIESNLYWDLRNELCVQVSDRVFNQLYIDLRDQLRDRLIIEFYDKPEKWH